MIVKINLPLNVAVVSKQKRIIAVVRRSLILFLKINLLIQIHFVMRLGHVMIGVNVLGKQAQVLLKNLQYSLFLIICLDKGNEITLVTAQK